MISTVGRRRSSNFLAHWHDKELTVEGQRLTWCVIASPGRTPFIAWCKVDGRPMHITIGKRLLAEAGHEDAALDAVGEHPSRPFTGPPLRLDDEPG